MRDHPRRVRVAGDLFHGLLPTGAVYVGRAAPGLPRSRYANPHRVGFCRACESVHDRSGSVAAYARYLADQPNLMAAARRELTGADLACWCRPGQLCHGDVLLAIVNVCSPVSKGSPVGLSCAVCGSRRGPARQADPHCTRNVADALRAVLGQLGTG